MPSFYSLVKFYGLEPGKIKQPQNLQPPYRTTKINYGIRNIPFPLAPYDSQNG